MLISIHRQAKAHAAIGRGLFRIHLLAMDQSDVSQHFARPGMESRDQFPDAPESPEATPPHIPGCLAWAVCQVVSRHDEADHTLFVGKIVESRVARPETEPLVYHHAAYRCLGSEIQ